MEIKIDTENKTISVENATLGELFEFMQKIENWKEYKINNEPRVIQIPYRYDEFTPHIGGFKFAKYTDASKEIQL